MADDSVFPDTVYKETVLEPLFNGAKTHFVGPLRQINQAHLVMLSETGVLTSAQSCTIANALNDIDNSVDVDALTYTGEHEDYFFLVESELRKRLGPDDGGLLHTARSRNDMDHTLFKMVLKEHTGALIKETLELANTFADKAETERDTLIVAYTHGQPAQPTTFGHYLSAALEVLIRDLERLSAAYANLDHCPMGAAAITTSGFPIDRQRMASLLGFDKVLINSYGCIASVDYITGLYSAIKLMFLHLGRLIQDLQFWSAFEVSQLYVPNSLVQISSIMPQKRNPVPIEHLRHLASVTTGHCDSIINTMHNTPFTDMNDSEGEVQQAGYSVFSRGSRVLNLLSRLIRDCSIQKDSVAKNIDNTCITVTELADTLVRTEQLSFRQAHEIAAVTAKSVISQKLPLAHGYDAFHKAFNEQTGRNTSMSQSNFEQAVSARTFVNLREREGGPAPKAMDSALQSYRAQIAALHSTADENMQRQVDAVAQLQSAYAGLLK